MAHSIPFAALSQVQLSELRSESYIEVSNDIAEMSYEERMQSAPTARIETDWDLREECRICGKQEGEREMASTGECGHWFCEGCVRDYLDEKVSEGVTQITCPSFNCQKHLRDSVLKRYLTDEQFNKLMKFRRWAELETNPDFRWCPKADCQGFDYGGLQKKKLKCQLCGFEYCIYCSEAWHSSIKCKSNLSKLDRWMHSHHGKFCPVCRSRIVKNYGCNHMTCLRCRHEFCWLCGDSFTYDHFRTCSVARMKHKNPPWKLTLALLCTPIWLPFVFVILTAVFIQNYTRDREAGPMQQFVRRWYLSCPVLLTLALVATPLAFTVCILAGFVVVLIRWGHHLRYNSYSCMWLRKVARKRAWWTMFATLAGLALSPVAALLVALAFLFGPIVGLLCVIWKIAIISVVRLCCNSQFMQPQGRIPGYPMG